MLKLYELRWSHYCEKIRLALSYMNIPYQAVGINAFSKSEFRGFEKPAHLRNYTVPAIFDENTDAFVMDSTPILRYLSKSYPAHAPLFPGDEVNRALIEAKLLEFDTKLALLARRFCYSQVILECPAFLPKLFLGNSVNALSPIPSFNWLVGHGLGLTLSKRFDIHFSESENLYEGLEQYLLTLSDELKDRAFVVGDSFSAADLALAAQLRPLTIVPFYFEHPALQTLFKRQAIVLHRYSNEGEFPYQEAIRIARLGKPPYRRKIRSLTVNLPFSVDKGFAANDQHDVWDLGLLNMCWRYFYIWKNKRRVLIADNVWR